MFCIQAHIVMVVLYTYIYIIILEGSCLLGYDAMSIGKVTDIWEAIAPTHFQGLCILQRPFTN
jgi:hypothetical protein